MKVIILIKQFIFCSDNTKKNVVQHEVWLVFKKKEKQDSYSHEQDQESLL